MQRRHVIYALPLLATLACTFELSIDTLGSETCSDTGWSDDSDPSPEPGVRRSVSQLSAAERREIRDAIIALKHMPPIWDYVSVCEGSDPAVPLAEEGPKPYVTNAYDYFVELHTRGAAIAAWKMTTIDPVPELPDSYLHMSSTFLPWHREFLLRFEEALRIASGNDQLMLPYWDWTNPAETAIVFSDDFLGGLGNSSSKPHPISGVLGQAEFSVNIWTPDASQFGPTTTGLDGRSLDERNDVIVPQLVVASCNPDPDVHVPLARLDGQGGLPCAAEVAATMAVDTYDVDPWNMMVDPSLSFRQQLEGFPVLPLNLDCKDQSWEACWNSETGVTALDMFLFFFGQTMHAKVHGTVGGHMGAYSAPNDPVFFLHHAMVDRIWAKWQDEHGFSMADYPDDPEHEVLYGFDVPAAEVWDYRELGYSYN